MLRVIILILAIFLLSNCDTTKKNIFAPGKKIFKQLPANADQYPSYKFGWLDGCETGFATGFANDFYKVFYKFQKDHKMIEKNDQQYLRAWSAAMIYCRHYAVGTLKEAGMTPRLPGQGFALPLGDSTYSHSIFGNSMSLNKQGAMGLSKW